MLSLLPTLTNGVRNLLFSASSYNIGLSKESAWQIVHLFPNNTRWVNSVRPLGVCPHLSGKFDCFQGLLSKWGNLWPQTSEMNPKCFWDLCTAMSIRSFNANRSLCAFTGSCMRAWEPGYLAHTQQLHHLPALSFLYDKAASWLWKPDACWGERAPAAAMLYCCSLMHFLASALSEHFLIYNLVSAMSWQCLSYRAHQNHNYNKMCN